MTDGQKQLPKTLLCMHVCFFFSASFTCTHLELLHPGRKHKPSEGEDIGVSKKAKFEESKGIVALYCTHYLNYGTHILFFFDQKLWLLLFCCSICVAIISLVIWKAHRHQ